MFNIQVFKDGDKELLARNDGYINATALCKRAGKLFAHYMENKTTKGFLEELSSVIGIPITALVQTIQGRHSTLL